MSIPIFHHGGTLCQNCPTAKCPNPSPKDKKLSHVGRITQIQGTKGTYYTAEDNPENGKSVPPPPPPQNGWSNNVKPGMTLLDFSRELAASVLAPAGVRAALEVSPHTSLQERIQCSPEQPPCAHSSGPAPPQTAKAKHSEVRRPGDFCPMLDPSSGNLCSRTPTGLGKLSNLCLV